MTAWRRLATERSRGMDLGPIPWSAVVRWCERRGLNRDAESLVVGVLEYLEQERIAAINAQREIDKLTGGKGA